MPKKVSQTVLPFKLIEEKSDSCVTALAGLPLISELFRQLGLPHLIQKWVRVKKRGFDAWRLIEWLIALAIAGGNHLDDIRLLKSDKALGKLIGWQKIPCAKTFERFLKIFDTKNKRGSFALWGLGEVNRLLAHQMIKQSGLKQVTLECDASVIESWKREAQFTYLGSKGYQPSIGVIAELGLIVYDEFRDGNVAARTDVQDFVYQCLKAIPKGIKIRVRLDGAYYDHRLIQYLNRKKIDWTITASKTSGFLDWVEALPESDWQDLFIQTPQGPKKTGRQWAQLHWMSTAWSSRRQMRRHQYRYIVTRQNQEQTECYAEHQDQARKDRYQVIATNMTGSGDQLIDFHYGKAGSIEHVHSRLKSDLGAGTLPCANFGANSAWFRIQVLAHNLLRILQIKCLPESLKNVRLKNLRFHLLNIAGRVVYSARQTFLKLTASHPSLATYQQARQQIAALVFW